MRVIEPNAVKKPAPEPAKVSKKRSLPKKKIAGGLVVIALMAALIGGWWLTKSDSVSDTNDRQKSNAISQPTEVKNKGEIKTFTSDQFRDLYNSYAYPNTQEITSPPTITGNQIADARIRSLAESRGYRLRSVPVQPIQKIGDPYLGDDDLLQPLALAGWQTLKDAAAKDGMPLRIVSAYRSPDFQRSLFLGRLSAQGVTIQQVADSQADTAINFVLASTAIPGYSRHHTGYTVDLQCQTGALEEFVNSPCFQWISKNNYLNAKKAGWIPSYPSDTEGQGPEPEPWEYVWVGLDAVTQ